MKINSFIFHFVPLWKSLQNVSITSLHSFHTSQTKAHTSISHGLQCHRLVSQDDPHYIINMSYLSLSRLNLQTATENNKREEEENSTKSFSHEWTNYKRLTVRHIVTLVRRLWKGATTWRNGDRRVRKCRLCDC